MDIALPSAVILDHMSTTLHRLKIKTLYPITVNSYVPTALEPGVATIV